METSYLILLNQAQLLIFSIYIFWIKKQKLSANSPAKLKDTRTVISKVLKLEEIYDEYDSKGR